VNVSEDVKWFEQESEHRGLEQPELAAKKAFSGRVFEISSDKTNNQSTKIIRQFVFSVYIWGGLGIMPKMKPVNNNKW